MAKFERFLITPLKSGLQTNLRPWQIMDDSFEELQNAYTFRGRGRKRFGSRFMGTSQLTSRLRVNLGTNTNAAMNLPANTSSNTPQLAIGQMFSLGTSIFTVYQLGMGVDTLSTDITATAVIDSTSSPNTITVTSGALVSLYWYPALPVMGITQYLIGGTNNHPTYAFDTEFAYFYTPGSGWNRSGTAIWNGTLNNYFWATNWQGSATSSNTGIPVLFVSNFNFNTGPNRPAATDDPIWAYNGNTWTSLLGSTPNGIFFLPNPIRNSPLPPYMGPFVQTARIIIAFKGTLLLLNTVENDNSVSQTPLPSTDGSGNASGTVPAASGIIGQIFYIGTTTFTVTLASGALSVSAGGTGTGTFDTTTGAYTFSGATATSPIYFSSGSGTATQYSNRCRYSWYGTPFGVNSWYEPGTMDSVGNSGAGANFIDADTQEDIIGAAFIKDHLIVYFERSTWEIAYTGNQFDPFQWRRLNSELGSQSTFSVVPFDKQVLTIGSTGIHACNGSNVVRTDNMVPDIIFDDFSAIPSQVNRIQGIRDYVNELVYWAYVDIPNDADEFPNQILVYNYENGAWAQFDDCFTAFGYWEQRPDETWDSLANLTWNDLASTTWSSFSNSANQRAVIGGTPQGFLLMLDNDMSENAQSMYITTMTLSGNILTLTIYNHNLSTNTIEQGGNSDYIRIMNVVGDDTTMLLNGLIFPVYRVVNANQITVQVPPTIDAVDYDGGGTCSRVSNIRIKTKQFNPYDKDDRNVLIQSINFAVKKTSSGQVTVDYFPSSSSVSMIEGGVASGAIMGTSVLETSPYDILYAPMEQYQDLLWHTVYFQCSAESIQFLLYMTHDQMIDPTISLSDFELEGMILYAKPTDQRMK